MCCIEYIKIVHMYIKLIIHTVLIKWIVLVHALHFGLTRLAIGLGVILNHLQFCHLKFIILLVVIIGILLELSLNFCRVNVRVEIRHNWEDDTHHQQERGKQDVLSPLWKMRREETQNCYRWIRLCLLWLLAECCEADMMGAH